ncbi:GNAT family N-acetyltransferase [Bacillus sp. Bva_UNVM-123]|uniref:GNAT family N-acetyltransferase n=1 Tax=Bacillus sp. Bva_UNVM-123 TaxID=2829798 RepID=UPI00391F71B2
MKNNHIVTLDFYKQEYELPLENYFLPEEQLNYTGLPLDAIKKCELDDSRYPIVILFNHEPAGFFVLHGWEGVKEYWDNKNALLLRAYSVNHSFQGNGIAKKSLQSLPLFVKEHFSSINEVILAVNATNKVAQQVYLKCGFIDKGIRAMGSKGELFIYHLDV